MSAATTLGWWWVREPAVGQDARPISPRATQDMFLAGTIVLLLGVMTVIGTFLSDLILMWVDPRIRLEGR